MMISAAWIIVLAGVAIAQPVVQDAVNINDRVDKMIGWHNNMIQNKGLGVLALEDGKYGQNAPQAIVGIDSAHRTGDCLQTQTENGFKVTCSIGLRLLSFVWKSLSIGEDKMSAIYRVGKNSFDLEISVVKTDSTCKSTLDKWAFTEFSDTNLSTSVPAYDKKEPENFSKAVLEHVNAALAQREAHEDVESKLDWYYCQKK